MTSTSSVGDAHFHPVILASQYGGRKYTRPKPRAQPSSSSDEGEAQPLARSASAARRLLPAGRRQLQTRVRRLQRSQAAAASAPTQQTAMRARPSQQPTAAAHNRHEDNANSSNNDAETVFISASAAPAASPLHAAASPAVVGTPASHRFHSQRFSQRDRGAAAASASAGNNARLRPVDAQRDGLPSPSSPQPSPSSPSSAVFSVSSDSESSVLSQPSPAVLSQVQSLLSGGQWRRRRQRRAQAQWQRGVESGLELLTERAERQAELVELKRRSDEVQVSSRMQTLEDRVLRGLKELSRGQQTLRREMQRSRADEQRKRRKTTHETPPSSGSAGSAPSSQTVTAAAPASQPPAIKPLQPPAADGVIHTEEQLLWTLMHFDGI